MSIKPVCRDSDDTLWHHGTYYEGAARRFQEILLPFATNVAVSGRHQEVEMRKLAIYGYGAKSFTLSLIETA